MRPRRQIRRPQRELRKFIREIVEDRQRFPHRDRAVDQRRHLARRRMLQDRSLVVALVKRNDDFLERNFMVGEREIGPERGVRGCATDHDQERAAIERAGRARPGR